MIYIKDFQVNNYPFWRFCSFLLKLNRYSHNGHQFFYWEQYKDVIYSPPKFSRNEIILLSVGTDDLFYTLCLLCSAHQHTIIVSSYLSYVISTMVFKDTLSSLSLFDGTRAQCISIIPYRVISWHWQWSLFVWATVSSSILKWTADVHEWSICPNLMRICYSPSTRNLWISLKNQHQQKTIIKSFPLVWILCHCGDRVR